MLYGEFYLGIEGAVYQNYVMPAILHGSDTWCLNENEMGILQWTESSTVIAMCGMSLRYGNRA